MATSEFPASSAAPLVQQRCQPMEGRSALTSDEIDQLLVHAPGWVLAEGAIEKRYGFPDFHRTVAFVNALAWVANAEDHHPELLVSYGQCTVRFNTHAVGGISFNDFICAAKVDALLA